MASCLICGSKRQRLFGFKNGKSVFKCDNCAVRTLEPQPTSAELDDFYARPDYFSSDLAELHDDLKIGYDVNAPIIKLYNKHLAALTGYLKPGASILEVGCARGVFMDLAVRAGYDVTGIEVNKRAAVYARGNFNLNIFNGALKDYVAGQRFDAIVALDVLEHLADPTELIKRAYDLLQPGGVLYLGTPNSDSVIYQLSEWLARLGYKYPAYRFFGRGIEHLFIFNRKNLYQLLDRNNFKPQWLFNYSIPSRNLCRMKGLYSILGKIVDYTPYEIAVIGVRKND